LLAVYLALSSQRKEETAKVAAAVRPEVASLTTYNVFLVATQTGRGDLLFYEQ